EQLQAFFQQLPVPALVIRAEQGIIPLSVFQQRLSWLLQGQLISLPGHHHFHLEASTCAAVATALKAFLTHVWTGGVVPGGAAVWRPGGAVAQLSGCQLVAAGTGPLRLWSVV